MYSELSEQHLQLRKMARDFTEKEILPKIEGWDRQRLFPTDLFKKMGELGFMGLLVPEEYGGAGLDTLAYAVVMEEISRGDVGIGLSWGGHMSLGTMPYVMYGSEEQKQKYLTRLAAGEYLGAMGLTEPSAGSDAAGTRTRAVLDGDQWVVNGAKCFISNTGTDISYGGVFLVVSDVDGNGRKEFSTLIIEHGTPGYTLGKNYEKMGWHTGDTREQIFENCRVPKENLLGTRGAGLRQFLSVLDIGRVGFASSCLGLARACLEAALEYAKQREQFGRPISKFQAIQFKLANMAANIELARLIIHKAACLRDQGKPFSHEAAIAKYFASKIAVEAASEAVQIHGGYGYIEEYPVCRYYRNAKILEIGEGSNEICQMVIARNLGC